MTKFLCQHCGKPYSHEEAVEAFAKIECPPWTPSAFCSSKCRDWFIGANGTDRPKIVAEISVGNWAACALSCVIPGVATPGFGT